MASFGKSLRPGPAGVEAGGTRLVGRLGRPSGRADRVQTDTKTYTV